MTRSALIHIAAAVALVPFVALSYSGWWFWPYVAAMLGYAAANGYWQSRFAAARWEGWMARLLFHFALTFIVLYSFGAAHSLLAFALGEPPLHFTRYLGALTLGTIFAAQSLKFYCAYRLFRDGFGGGGGGGLREKTKKRERRPSWLRRGASDPSPS